MRPRRPLEIEFHFHFTCWSNGMISCRRPPFIGLGTLTDRFRFLAKPFADRPRVTSRTSTPGNVVATISRVVTELKHDVSSVISPLPSDRLARKSPTSQRNPKNPKPPALHLTQTREHGRVHARWQTRTPGLSLRPSFKARALQLVF